MFCPKCGLQQAGDDVRFCSRCGFQLEVVRGLLTTDGVLVWAEAETDKHSRQRSPRHRGILQGIMLMLLTALIVPVAALLSKAGLLPREFVALAAIICAVGGFMRLVFALMFEEGARTARRLAPGYKAPATQAQFKTGSAPSALPPQQFRPASELFGGARTDTAEIIHPPSVTENTTRLLERFDDK